MTTFLESIETFLRNHPQVRPTRLGKEAVGDANLVRQVREGREPRNATVFAVTRWMDRYDKAAKRRAAADKRRASAAEQASP